MADIIKVEHLSYVYNPGLPTAVTALDDVSFTVEEGDFVGIIGATGSGKSTLITHMNGLNKPTSGKIYIDGRDLWADPEKIRDFRFLTGLVFQYPEYQLFEETCYKDIAFGPKNMGLDEAEIDRRVHEAADFVGLDPALLERSPFELSGGQKRRVAVAGVMAMRPRILVLDEPADIPREVWSQILRPALADRQGRALFCGTPKGCDNLLHDVWQLAGSLGASEGWSRFRFPASQTGCLPQTELDAARQRLGLDGPIWEQYQRWAGNVLDGDFGMSLKYKRPVVDVVLPLLGNTLLLGGLAYALVFVLAIALALLCARFEHSALDRLICRVGTTAYYVPAFWLGVLLVLVFSVNLEWLPSSGAYSYGKAGDIADRARHLVLPLAVMVASHLWYYAYMIRNKLLDEVRRDYVLLARSKGLGRTRVLWSHCLRNVMPTVVGIMAISIPHVLSGTYVAEAVFNYPGIGLLAISSAKYHDYNLLMLMVLFTGAMVIISSLLAQSINEAIDPRIKSGEVVC